MTRGVRVVVLGYLIRGPLGGLAWHHLQYAMGLAALGHDVLFLEDSDDYASCYDPSRDAMGTDPTYGLRFAAKTFARVGLGERWAYHDAHTSTWHGPLGEGSAARVASADLVLNLSGVNPLRPWLESVPARAFVDTDPVFTQVRHLTEPAARALAARHTSHFTFGERIGVGADVPDDGFRWQPTRQPIALHAWPVAPGPESGPFTTVMQWDSYRAREWNGRRYGMKSESFAPFADLPSHVAHPLELALGSASAPREELPAKGWRVRDPLEVTRDPWTYQAYLAGSKGELSVAKHGYVASGCGWFSERSAAYLATGRPVVVQDTGFSSWLPTGRGVVAFSSVKEAIAGLDAIAAEYDRHCRAARDIAAEYFDARAVLTGLVERALERSA